MPGTGSLAVKLHFKRSDPTIIEYSICESRYKGTLEGMPESGTLDLGVTTSRTHPSRHAEAYLDIPGVGLKKVFVKWASSDDRDQGRREKILREAKMYGEKLSGLQGKSVPVFIGCFALRDIVVSVFEFFNCVVWEDRISREGFFTSEEFL